MRPGRACSEATSARNHTTVPSVNTYTIPAPSSRHSRQNAGQRQSEQQSAQRRPGDVGQLKNRAAPRHGVNEMNLRHQMRDQRRACRRRKCAPCADKKQHHVNGQNVLCVVARQLDQRAGTKNLQRVAGQNYAPAVEAVGHVTRGQQKKQPRQKQRQPRVAKINGAVRDGVDLPRHRDRLRFSAQNHGHSRKLVSPEITGGESLKAAARLWGGGLHGLLSGYNGTRSPPLGRIVKQ